MGQVEGTVSNDSLPDQLLTSLCDEIKKEFPLQGKIQSVDGDSVQINIGNEQGVLPGQVFAIYPAAAQPDYEDILNALTPLGKISLEDIGDTASKGKLLSSEVAIEPGMRVRIEK